MQMHGMMSLLAVAALWGSYSPVLKFLFSHPSPPSAALMTATQALLAAAFLLAGTLGGASVSVSVSASASAARREGKAGGGGGGSVAGQAARARAAFGLVMGGLVARLRSAVRAGAAAWRRRVVWGARGNPRRREPLFPPKQPPQSGPAGGLEHTAAEQHQQQQLYPQSPGRSGPLGRHHQQQHHHQHHHQQHHHHAGAHGSGAHGSGDEGDGGIRGRVLAEAPEGPVEACPGRCSGEGPPERQHSLSGVSACGPLGRHHHHHHLGDDDDGAVAATALVPDGGGGGGPYQRGGSRVRNLLAVPLGSLVAVGLELGTYNFCAAALGTWGVQRISATKVAFLGQATSLITPLLVALSGQRVALVVWAACGCGVLGAALVALDGAGRAAVAESAGNIAVAGGLAPPLMLVAADLAAAAGAGGVSRAMRLETGAVDVGAGLAAGAGAGAAHPRLSWLRNPLPPALSRESMGANYVLASCLFYALGTVRVGVHSGCFAPLDLAAASALGYAALATMWLLAEVLGTPGGGSSVLSVVGALLRDNATLAMLLWAGFGPGALSSYLQVLGQRVVPAAQAQMLYSSAPFWSALIARLLLRGRDGAMGPMAWLGGSVMLSASLLASLLDSRSGAASGASRARAGPATAVAVAAAATAAVTTGPGGSAPPGGVGSPRWRSGGEAGGHLRGADRDL